MAVRGELRRHFIGVGSLDGDVALQFRVARAVHLSHSPDANETDDFIRAEPRARCQRHGAYYGFAEKWLQGVA